MQSIKEIVEELALNNLLPRFPASPDPGKDAVPDQTIHSKTRNPATFVVESNHRPLLPAWGGSVLWVNLQSSPIYLCLFWGFIQLSPLLIHFAFAFLARRLSCVTYFGKTLNEMAHNQEFASQLPGP